MLITSSPSELVPVFQQGGVFAYPTEAIYGLGCDPENEAAVHHLLNLKRRSIKKGLILVAADASQVEAYIESIDRSYAHLLAPSNITYVVPARQETPKWLTGEFHSLAIRISKHSLVQELCQACHSALVSTSANIANEPPARDFLSLKHWADHLSRSRSHSIDAILKGDTGGQEKPSRIIDIITGEILRY